MDITNSKELIESLILFIRNSYSPDEKITKAKDGSETVFYRKAGKSLCYIEERDFKYKVTIVIGAGLTETIESSNVSKKTKEMFKNAKQYYDGKWLFFEVNTLRDVEDIKALLVIKKPLKK